MEKELYSERGRLTLIKSTLPNLPIYVMSMLSMLENGCKKVGKDYKRLFVGCGRAEWWTTFGLIELIL